MNPAPPQHAADQLPVVTASNGQPFMPCDAVLALLRAIAASCVSLADDPDCDLHSASAAIESEADALETRAIAHTAAVP